jgi:hypothetical protein
VQLLDVPCDRRAPILNAYVLVAPGGRPHFPFDINAPLAEFERLAPAFPVFSVESAHAGRQ